MANVKMDDNRIKVQPQAVDVEQAVLCSMMMDKEAIANAIEAIDETYFYKDNHRKIFQAIVELFDKHESVDLYTITEMLKKRNMLDDAGGSYYLAELANIVPSSANVIYHLNIVKEKAIARKLITACNGVINSAYSQEKEADLLLDEAEKAIFEISEKRLKKGFESINPLLHSTFERIEELYHTSPTGVTGISTGYKKLNEFTAGFQKSDLIVLAGRPSMGKTAFALNLAR
ncbi:MAG: replicative DNA helicase, partial [Calditrichales bacterium]